MIKHEYRKVALIMGLFLVFSSFSANAVKYCAYIGQELNGNKISGVEGVGSAPTMDIACLKAKNTCNRKLTIAKQENRASNSAVCKRYLVP